MINLNAYKFEKALQQLKTPPKLTAKEKDRMRQRKMKKHDVAILLVHWFNAFTWMFMLATGFALIISAFYKVAPDFYINIVRALFGNAADMLEAHIWLGVIWIVVFSMYTIFGYRKYLRKNPVEHAKLKQGGWLQKFKTFQCVLFGNKALCIDEDDINWLKLRVLGILGKSTEPLPPQGSFNGGQKMYGLLVALMTPIIMITGLIMSFHLGAVWLVQWAIPIHFVAIGLVVSGLLIHVYMGAVLPEEKPAFFSMLTGNTSELFLYKHHFKFWKKRILEQYKWRKENVEEVDLYDLLPDNVASEVEKLAVNIEEPVKEIKIKDMEPKPFWNPYIVGALLGMVMLLTFFLLGRGVGASSALSRLGAYIYSFFSFDYVANNPAWGRYVSHGKNPLMNFMIFEVLGVILGGYFAAKQGRRVKVEVLKGPNISKTTRLIFAFLGGIFMGIGARIARGCTSGLALTGGATMALGGWVFMLTIFAVGFIGAYFLRRLWL